MTAVLTTRTPCPPYCDAGPDGGVFCGGGENHIPGWPVGLPDEGDPVVAEDGTVVTVGITDVGGGELRLSLILRHPDREVHLPLSDDAAFDLQYVLAVARVRLSRYDDDRPTLMSVTDECTARDWHASQAAMGVPA